MLPGLKKNKVMLLMSLYQFFTSHEPNYIHNFIYVRVIKKQQFFSPHNIL